MDQVFLRNQLGARLLISATLIAFTLGVPGKPTAATLDDAVAFYKHGAFDDAAPILEQLADAGDPTANFWLASMWHQGRGKPVNYRTAHNLYRTAAYHGNADAQNNLGLLYRDGEGVEQNSVVSYAWFALAAAQDNPVAERNLDRLSRRLRPNQVLEGQQLAAEYLVWIARTRDVGGTARKHTPIDSARPHAAKKSRPPADAGAASPVPSVKARATGTPGRDHFLVQLGLFRDPSGIKRLESNLRKRGIRFVNQPIEIRGTQYQRIRVGPFDDPRSARQTATKINRLFKITSAVIPLPS